MIVSQVSHFGECDKTVCDFDLDRALNYLVRIQMFLISHADAILREGSVAGRESSIDVAISRRTLPVRVIQSISVGKELVRPDSLRGLCIGRKADFSIDAECSL